MLRAVYVYDGPGASQLSSNLLLSSLRRCLCPASHTVQTISPHDIKKGEWTENCAAVVFGGGYDLGFVESLGPEGAQVIHRYVMEGGTYLGLCAGAYFACRSIQFEKGSPTMEVCGPRPLNFYPGQCQGSVAPNFTYNSQRGAAALPITVPDLERETTLHAYVNGGGFFSPPSAPDDLRRVETLARFASLEGRPAAVVRCQVGDRGGVALLSSPHIEFAAFELSPTDRHLMGIERRLRHSDGAREALLRSFLERGGLRLRLTSSL